MARQVKANIELESGKKLTHYQRVTISQDLFSHHLFEVLIPFEMLEDGKERFFNQSHKDVCGKLITFSLSPYHEEDKTDFVFKGIVTEIALKNTSALSNSFVLKGYSPTYLLEDGPRRRTFVKQSMEQIFTKVLHPYPKNLLKRTLKPKHQAELAYVVQYDESNFAFLNRLAAEYGEWFYYNGKELVLGSAGPANSIDFKIDGIQTFDMSIGLNPSKFMIAHYDYLKHQHYSGKSDGQSVSGLSQFGSFALQESDKLFSQASQLLANKPMKDSSELNTEIKTRKSLEAARLIEFRGTGENPNVSVGTAIKVKGLRPGSSSEDDFGKYRITEITHGIDGSGNYQNSFNAIPESAEYPPKNSRIQPPLGKTEAAEVTDNDDPEKLGRVKVKFFWPDAEEAESDWIRTTNAYTGEGEGMLWVPEISAQVLISYENGLPDFPVVIGSLYYKKSGLTYTHNDNAVKVIRTKAGNIITFSDENDDEAITISNSNKESTHIIIKFKDNGSINIETEGTLTLKAKEIEMKAQSIKIEADQEIKMEAKSKLTAKSTNISVEADASVEMKANANLKLSATANASLEGNALVKIKGALVQLN